MSKSNRLLGWKPDLPDLRDFLYDDHHATLPFLSLKKSVDLRQNFPSIYDQGDTSSCTSQAIAAVCCFDLKIQNQPVFNPSRLFIYWNERNIEGDTNHDDGAVVRDGIKAVATYGFAPETDWPFDVKKLLVKPDDKVFADATKFKAINYYRLDGTNLRQLKSALCNGHPFVTGITVYPSFEDNDGGSGLVPMPQDGEKPEGGHCVAIVGYDDGKQCFLLRNSWGVNCGDGTGHYWLPYDYLTNEQLADDFWVIKTVT